MVMSLVNADCHANPAYSLLVAGERRGSCDVGLDPRWRLIVRHGMSRQPADGLVRQALSPLFAGKVELKLRRACFVLRSCAPDAVRKKDSPRRPGCARTCLSLVGLEFVHQPRRILMGSVTQKVGPPFPDEPSADCWRCRTP